MLRRAPRSRPASPKPKGRRAIAELRTGIVLSLASRGSEENAAFYRRVAPTSGTILGVKVPVIRELVRQFVTDHPDLSVDDAVGLADLAFVTRCREEQLFAAFLLARHKRALTPAHWATLDRWVDWIDNWEAGDQLAMGVAGEIVARLPALVADLENWSGSENPWRRRFAVACTTVLNQKGRADASAALRVCRHLIRETDKSVQKAIGWALREACKSDAEAVFDFLNIHKGVLPARVLRESAEKLCATKRRKLGLA